LELFLSEKEERVGILVVALATHQHHRSEMLRSLRKLSTSAATASSQAQGLVLTSFKNGVTTITMNNPAKLNGTSALFFFLRPLSYPLLIQYPQDGRLI
jgi:hypothetical protein